MKKIRYFSEAYFIYNDDSKSIIDIIKANEFGTHIMPLHVKEFVENIDTIVMFSNLCQHQVIPKIIS